MIAEFLDRAVVLNQLKELMESIASGCEERLRKAEPLEEDPFCQAIEASPHVTFAELLTNIRALAYAPRYEDSCAATATTGDPLATRG
jgi:hypothetical protein